MEIVTGDWHVPHWAVHSEYFKGQHDKELSLLRHPSYPFLAKIPADPTTLFDELCSVAEDYIKRIKDLDGSLETALGFLTQRAPHGFGWLPITWDGPSGLIDPRGSFMVRRTRSGSEFDRTIVLMAGNRTLKGDVIENVENIAVGLRVVMHADPPTQANAVPIRITGLSMCELGRMVNPEQGAHERFEFFSALVQELVKQRLDVQKLNVAGFEVVNAQWLRFVGVAARPSPVKDMPTGVLWNVELSLTKDQRDAEFVSVREQAQYTHAVGPEVLPARLFHRDPASSGFACDIVERLPTHDTIDRYRDDGRSLPRELVDPEGRFQVLQSSIADRENHSDKVQSIDPLNLPLRSDHLAAAQAFLRAREFFNRLSDFDLPVEAYFKFAQLPLLMRHRAAFDAHPDGNAVIAQVRVVDSPMPTRDQSELSARPRLEVAFESAALRHREVHPDDHGRPSAQPMGLAADRRWAWHEFGHVLSYAATGALEYEFAHSVGDALAAVLNDPTSYLSGDPLYDGETYPWVPAGRRHDRDAAAGWCWCGRRNGQRNARLTFPPLLYKGYVEEQMLSSSVFRFYRAIGGHPSNETAMRERAAAAAAYLLVRSASLLGPGSLVPARSADALVSAMVDADIGTRQPSQQLFLGGCLHKVVRWAFERQGLFANASPGEIVEGPGLPPEVDLWVMDRRLNADKGGYEAVTLQWPRTQPEPDWFADPQQGAWEDESGNVHTIVRNRGAQEAANVAVRAWKAPAGSDTLRWDCLGDHHLATVPSGGAVPVFIAAGSSSAAHYLLVEVSASEDRSNLDAETRLPCATCTPPGQPEAVRDLVANDNNLALRLIS